MALTKENVLDFFRLLEDEYQENYAEVVDLINAYPSLINISNISNNFLLDFNLPPLLIAINKSKYNIAIKFLQSKANPNETSLDETQKFIKPILFYLLDKLAQLIESEDYKSSKEVLRLIAIMELHGLDYNRQMQAIISNKKHINALEYFLKLVSDNYGKQHKIYLLDEANKLPKYTLGDKAKNILKEQYYAYVIRHLLLKIDETFIQQIDANDYRVNSESLFFINEEGLYIDDFSIEICNQYVEEIFNYQIKNFYPLNIKIEPLNYIPLFKLVRE